MDKVFKRQPSGAFAHSSPMIRKGGVLFLTSAHLMLVSNILYLVVLHKSILPEALKGGVSEPLLRAVHGLAYALFLAYCSRKTTPQNQYNRAITGMQLGSAAALALLLLSLFFSTGLFPGSENSSLLPLLFYAALIIGGFGDAMATPSLLGIIASHGKEDGPKYVGFFWTGVSVSYIYIPILASWFLSLAKSSKGFSILPFSFDFALSMIAISVLSAAKRYMQKEPIKLKAEENPKKQSLPPTLLNLLKLLKTEKVILSCVLILAANQFAFNSLKTASQEFSAPWKDFGLAGNAIMFTVASYLISRWWNDKGTTRHKTRNWVLLSLWIILSVGFSIIMLKNSPLIGVGVMLLFGPFSALLHTGVNIYSAQYVMDEGTPNIGARLGMFSSLYRFLGSIGYLVTALIAIFHQYGAFHKMYLAFTINSLPVLMVIVFFALLTRRQLKRGGDYV